MSKKVILLLLLLAVGVCARPTRGYAQNSSRAHVSIGTHAGLKTHTYTIGVEAPFGPNDMFRVGPIFCIGKAETGEPTQSEFSKEIVGEQKTTVSGGVCVKAYIPRTLRPESNWEPTAMSATLATGSHTEIRFGLHFRGYQDIGLGIHLGYRLSRYSLYRNPLVGLSITI